MDPSHRNAWIRSVQQEYESSLIRYAAHLIGDIDQARDTVQETFLKLCAQQPSRVQPHVAQWLFTVCRNCAIDIRRRHKNHSDGGPPQPAPHAVSPPSQVQLLEHNEVWERVKEALEGLSANQQEVIRLKFQNGLSYREIHQVTGLSVSNIGFLIHTGIKKIREILARESSLAREQIRRVK